MAESFPLADILTITTGRFLGRDGVDGIYRILNYLTGDNLYTHQLTRAAEACRPALLSEHARLGQLPLPEDLRTSSLEAWLAEQERTHGKSLTVTPLAKWQHINPIAELVDRFGTDRVIPVVISGKEGL